MRRKSGHLAFCASRTLSTFHPLMRGSILRQPSGTYSHSGKLLCPDSCERPLPLSTSLAALMIIGGTEHFTSSLRVTAYTTRSRGEPLELRRKFLELSPSAAVCDPRLYPPTFVLADS